LHYSYELEEEKWSKCFVCCEHREHEVEHVVLGRFWKEIKKMHNTTVRNREVSANIMSGREKKKR